MCCMTNISNMFWLNAVDWKLVPGPFYDFIKMTILRDLAIFNSSQLRFLIVPYSPLQKKKKKKKKKKK